MKWSEVIMVRSAGSNAKILAKALQDLMADVARSPGKDDVRVFHRENIETDICIVLFHNEKKSRAGGSPLGLHLVAALKEFSLVYHTVWRECRFYRDRYERDNVRGIKNPRIENATPHEEKEHACDSTSHRRIQK